MANIKGFANLPLLIIGAVLVVGVVILSLSATNLGPNLITGPRPGTIGTLTATAVSSSQIDLSWVPGNATDGYDVERSLQSTTGFNKITTTSNTFYSNTGLASSTTYYYRVRPFRLDRNGTPTYGSYSNVARATTLSPPPPPALVASCLVSPTAILTGQSATWSASASGGTGLYTYLWSGTDGLTGTTTQVTKTYTLTGTKTASVTVTSGTQTQAPACSNTLTVSSPPPPASPADLRVISTVYNPTSTRNGDLMSFHGVIKNFGSSTASTSEARLRIDIYGNGSWDVVPVNRSTLALVSGASTPVAWFSAWTAVQGWHRFEICADATGVIPESSETNNCQIEWFSVSPVGSPPQVNAGLGHLLTASTTHTHDGASATDPDGNLSGYQWSFSRCYNRFKNINITCPPLLNSSGSISGGTEQTSVPGPTFTATSGDITHFLLLNVWDTAGWVVSSTAEEMTPTTSSPQANAGAGHTIAVSTTHVHDGATAYDPDGNLSSYSWSFTRCYNKITNSNAPCPIISNNFGSLSGGATTISVPGPTITVSTSTDRAYTLGLLVWDTTSWSASSTVDEATPFTSPPTASAGVGHILTASTSHAHDGGTASDVDGDLAQYFWNWSGCSYTATHQFVACPAMSNSSGYISGGTASTTVPGPTFTPNKDGVTHVLSLTVIDVAGWTYYSATSETTP